MPKNPNDVRNVSSAKGYRIISNMASKTEKTKNIQKMAMTPKNIMNFP